MFRYEHDAEIEVVEVEIKGGAGSPGSTEHLDQSTVEPVGGESLWIDVNSRILYVLRGVDIFKCLISSWCIHVYIYICHVYVMYIFYIIIMENVFYLIMYLIF